jgi:poly-gamma-glutamate synthesis protein (capsule biosynthesis protein)
MITEVRTTSKARLERVRLAVLLGGVAAVALILGTTVHAQAPKLNDMPQPPKRDWVKELEMKVPGAFTMATVGDMIINRPLSKFQDPGLQAALKILAEADVATGNQEANLHDDRTFVGPLRSFNGTKEVAPDLVKMGFDIVGRANNHSFSNELVGFYETNRLLDEAGLPYAGGGRDLDEARQATYITTAKGRVGMVDLHAVTGANAALATRRVGNLEGKPGINGLRLTRTVIVSPQQFAALKSVHDALWATRAQYTYPRFLPPESANELDLFGVSYRIGQRAGGSTYSMNEDDLAGNLEAIKNGKHNSNFMMVMIHAHQNDSDLERAHMGETPPDFLVEFAKKSIDNGADAFIGTGTHLLRGIEIYKGKPIFYTLGDFFHDLYLEKMPFTSRPEKTNAEAAVAMRDYSNGYSGLNNPINLQSIIPVSRYQDGRLVEIRLHPVDLRYEAQVVNLGIPRLSSPAMAQSILTRLQRLSKPFGTTITIEGNVGVIRPTA